MCSVLEQYATSWKYFAKSWPEYRPNVKNGDNVNLIAFLHSTDTGILHGNRLSINSRQKSLVDNLIHHAVLRKVRSGGVLRLRLVPVVLSRVISGGVVKLERIPVICPACGQQVEAVATDGRVKGYCAVAKQHVSFQIEAQRIPIGKHRDSRGRFIKGNVPWNKRRPVGSIELGTRK